MFSFVLLKVISTKEEFNAGENTHKTHASLCHLYGMKMLPVLLGLKLARSKAVVEPKQHNQEFT